MYFNISHTRGIGVVVFSRQEIGIDIEKIECFNRRIVERFYCSEEKKYIFDEKDEEKRKQHFYEIWTKKEAYLKWSGTGIRGESMRINVLKLRYQFEIWDVDEEQYAIAIYSQQ